MLNERIDTHPCIEEAKLDPIKTLANQAITEAYSD